MMDKVNNLGLSLYVDEKFLVDEVYWKKAYSLGYHRIFCNAKSLMKSEMLRNHTIAIWQQLAKFGYQIFLDVNKHVIKTLDFKIEDTLSFKQMGLWGIRLDEPFDGIESKLSNNQDGLMIIHNASASLKSLKWYVDGLNANRDQMYSIWNFYPQEFTGANYSNFFQHNLEIKRHFNIKVGAFIVDPFCDEKWPTLECLRYKDVAFQTRLLYANNIDDVIFASSFVDPRQLAIVSEIDKNQIEFVLEDKQQLSTLEHDIVYKRSKELIRGDVSEYLARDSTCRKPTISYRKCDKKYFEKGDVLIVNDLMNQRNKSHCYAGELQFVLKDFVNDGTRNYVGHLSKDYQMLLDIMVMHFKSYTFVEK